jgi:DNA-binding transcriptional ArsR family regulator
MGPDVTAHVRARSADMQLLVAYRRPMCNHGLHDLSFPVSPTAPDDRLWAAIADPSRRRVLDLLVERGTATPTVLAASLPFTRQAVSKHLAVLQEAGLVESHRDGREVRYAVRLERLDVAARVVAHVAADWDRRLMTIKRIAETTHKEKP